MERSPPANWATEHKGQTDSEWVQSPLMCDISALAEGVAGWVAYGAAPSEHPLVLLPETCWSCLHVYVITHGISNV